MTDAERDAREMKLALLGAIQDFFDQQAGVPLQRQKRPADELQVATAVLLLFLVRADREVKQDEHRALERGLQRTFGLTPDETAMLLRQAEEAFEKGARLGELSATLDGSLTKAQKQKVVQALWRVAYADAELEAHEEYLVRKMAHLLSLSRADLLEAKLAAREEFLRDDL